ncbi:histidine--tRNA ligase [Flavobacterium terrisoli]|uniref:histidine--tRNA ligase n=1 Tax=Flavobacterium terrisoli TaxID=3242195 RepID=UPI002543CF86|nr:histidine--tRNA ligase [Flavobacterium buctense]
MAQKPSIPKGTRDFSPAEVSKRNYIISVMRNHFENFGYQPIETPSFENSDTLMGKYGEEGDRLIFKILNSGDFFDAFNKSLVEIIKTILYNLQFFANKFPGNDNYREFIEALTSKAVEDAFKRNPISEKIDYANLKHELNSIIVAHFLQRPDLLEQLKSSDNELLSLFSMTIYGVFISNAQSRKLSTPISEKALRYDLTVPFARYVVQHQGEIEFPFKRYQIQPVWRADRPQKGRFREFYQCDADVVGSTSLWQEVELVQLYDAVFAELGLNGVTIKINNRKILSGIAEVIGASDKLIDFTVALDKLDKIGEEGVKKEMMEKGISETALSKVQPLFSFTGTISEKLVKLESLLSTSEDGKKGIEELRFICDNVTKLGLKKANLDLDVTLARGLNYYTGAIFEVTAPEGVAMGSIGGGGRYDDLTGIFGLKNMSGVGISFGLDRIYLVLEELNLFPQTVTTSTKVMFLNFGESHAFEAMKAITFLRSQNIKAELYPDAAKIDKQFKHAERRSIPFVVKEINGDSFILKNLISGEQSETDLSGILAKLA